MWVWHACFATLNAPCNPRTWGQLGEMIAAFFLAVLAIIGLWLGVWAFLEWLDSRFGG